MMQAETLETKTMEKIPLDEYNTHECPECEGYLKWTNTIPAGAEIHIVFRCKQDQRHRVEVVYERSHALFEHLEEQAG